MNSSRDKQNGISPEKTRIFPRNRNFKRETESPLMATQNNANMTNYMKAKIYETQ